MWIFVAKASIFAWHCFVYAQLIPISIIPLWKVGLGNGKFKPFDWCYFAAIQIVAFDAMVIGWFLLIAPCVKRAWIPVTQIYIPDWQREQGIQPKRIFIWQWYWLNAIWGNDENGVVSGQRAGTEYNPEMSAFKAYLWCAWRNSANNLRFVFRWKGGPFYRWESANHNWYFQLGWYPNGFPVLSAGKV